MISREQVEEVLARHNDPHLDQDLRALQVLRAVRAGSSGLEVELEFAYACEQIRGGLAQLLAVAIGNLDDAGDVTVQVRSVIGSAPVREGVEPIPGVRNIIAVASGKGGVGKSTTAANLALALQREGARVGMLDGDIYGPSQGIMLGVPPETRPEVVDEKAFRPVQAHGLQVMTMAFLAGAKTPMIWRGPMVSGALIQLARQTLWEDLDYLVVDLPPGTGDIQLTLAQKIPVSGAVIVTTPQDIALVDAVRGIEMFAKVDIPVLGIVENMAFHVCAACGHESFLFGEGGGARVAAEYDTALLGSIPLSTMVREQADGGTPTVLAEPECQISMVYQEVARRTGARLSRLVRQDTTSGGESLIARGG